MDEPVWGTYEYFAGEMRKQIGDDVPDKFLRELWDLARDAGRRAAKAAGAEEEE